MRPVLNTALAALMLCAAILLPAGAASGAPFNSSGGCEGNARGLRSLRGGSRSAPGHRRRRHRVEPRPGRPFIKVPPPGPEVPRRPTSLRPPRDRSLTPA